MADILGTNIAAAIVPFTTGDTYPSHFAKYGHGGRMEVADNIERDAISTSRRSVGMLVYVQSTGVRYELVGGIANTNWIEFKGVANLIGLDDTPVDYTGKAGTLVRVNDTEDGIKFDNAVAFTEFGSIAVSPIADNILHGRLFTKRGTYTNGISNNTLLWMNAEADNPGDRMGRHTISFINDAGIIGTSKFGLKGYGGVNVNGFYGWTQVDGNLQDFDFRSTLQWSFDLWFYYDTGSSNFSIMEISTAEGVLELGTSALTDSLYFQGFGISMLNAATLTNGWQHLAIQRNGNSYRLFRNGILVASQVIDIGSAALTINSFKLVLSYSLNFTACDDIRWNKSVEYPDNGLGFIPNIEAYFLSDFAEDAYFVDGQDKNYNLSRPDWSDIQNVPGSVSGATFLSLADTPTLFTGHAGKIATVNTTETGLEFSPVAKDNYIGIAAPTLTDDSSSGYSIGSTWIDTAAVPKEAYRCMDASIGAAVWVNTTFTADEVTPLTWANITGKPLEFTPIQQDFLWLSDTPANYIGAAGMFVVVNATGTGVEFVAASSGGTAASTTVDITNLNNNLSATDTDVQKALETLDNLVLGSGSSATANGVVEYFTSIGDGVTTVFDILFLPSSADNVLVTLNGLLQKPTTDYTLTGSNITFIVAPLNTHTIEARQLNSSTALLIHAHDIFTSDGINNTFTMSVVVPNDDDILVTINGIVQTPTTAYSVSGTTLTLTAIPSSGLPIEIRTIGTNIQDVSNTILILKKSFLL